MSFADVPFYLDVTLCCGQVFRWDKIDDWWYGVAGDRAITTLIYDVYVVAPFFDMVVDAVLT